MHDMQDRVLAAFRKNAPHLVEFLLTNDNNPWLTILNNTVTNEELGADIRAYFKLSDEARQSYVYRAALELALMRLTGELPNPPRAFICQDIDIKNWNSALGRFEFSLSVGSEAAVVTSKYGAWVFYSKDTLESFIAGVEAGENQAVGSLVNHYHPSIR